MITDIDFRAVLDTSQFDKAIKGVSNKVAPLQNKFAGVSKRMAAVGAAAGVAAAGIAMAVKGSLNYADDMGKAAQKFGLPVETLSELAYAAELADVSLDQLGGGLNKLNKLMVSASEGNAKAKATFEQLGVSVTNADGSLRASEEVFADISEVISKMPDGAQKSALAMEVFGKAGASMIPLLNEGKTAIQAWGEEAKAAGLVVSGETAAAAEQFNDNLTRLSGAAKGFVMTLTAALAPALVAVTDAIIAAVQWFQNLPAPMQETIAVAGAIAGTLAAAGLAFGAIASPIGVAVTAIGTAITIVKALSTALLFLAANPVGATITAIALLAVAVYKIYENWDGIVEYFSGIWESIKATTVAVVDAIKVKWDEMTGYFTTLWESIKTVFSQAWEGIKAIVVGWVEDFKALGGMIIDGLKEGILQKWEDLKATITGMGDYIANSFKEALGIQSPSKVFHEFGGYIMEGLANGITDNAGLATDAVAKAAAGLKDKTLQADTDLKAFGQTIGDTFKGFITGSMDAQTALQQLSQKLMEMAMNSIFKSVFGNLFGGIFGGASADGNVFRGGSMKAFAKGGVVGGPTTFPMAGGKIGLMGEAGPEAIMPLSRGADGKLGVKMSGGGGTSGGVQVVNNVTVNPGQNQSPADARRYGQQIADIIDVKVMESMGRYKNSGAY